MNPQLIQIFHNPQICLQLRNEIVKKFQKYNIRGFQIMHHQRFEFLKDNYPIAFLIQILYHPNPTIIESFAKEEIFECFNGTILENVPILIKPELVL